MQLQSKLFETKGHLFIQRLYSARWGWLSSNNEGMLKIIHTYILGNAFLNDKA